MTWILISKNPNIIFMTGYISNFVILRTVWLIVLVGGLEGFMFSTLFIDANNSWELVHIHLESVPEENK